MFPRPLCWRSFNQLREVRQTGAGGRGGTEIVSTINQSVTAWPAYLSPPHDWDWPTRHGRNEWIFISNLSWAGLSRAGLVTWSWGVGILSRLSGQWLSSNNSTLAHCYCSSLLPTSRTSDQPIDSRETLHITTHHTPHQAYLECYPGPPLWYQITDSQLMKCQRRPGPSCNSNSYRIENVFRDFIFPSLLPLHLTGSGRRSFVIVT